MKKNFIFLVLSFVLYSCGNDNVNESTIDQNTVLKVEYYGALKNMMHKGDISSKFELSNYANVEHLYAIGAMENLKGEIQIFDAKPTNTFVKDSSVTFDQSFDKNATLLVSSVVPKWNSYNVPEEISSYEELERYIATIAENNGINIHEPFPFLIEGEIKSLEWHVINWKDGDMEHTHEKHVNSGLNGTIENSQVELLGFYSDAHHTIFTHHSTNMHIHFKTNDLTLAGHVDGLTLGKGMTIKLPSN